MTNKTVTMEAKVDAGQKDSIAISYVVHNRRATKIYVYNLLYHTDVYGNRTPQPELAYVMPSTNGTVVGKFEVPIPPGVKTESAEIPYLDPLEPGQDLAGKIVLRLPLQIFAPYPIAETNLTAQQLRLQIGFLDPLHAAPKEALIEPAQGAGAGHFQCDYGLGLKYQEMLAQEITLPQLAR